MRSLPVGLLCLVLAACGDEDGFTFEPVGPVPETGSLAGMTDAHNQVRADATPPPDPALPPLAWDEDVAGVAQGWANVLAERDCPLEHNPHRGSLGENVFWGFGTTFTGPDVVHSWASEAACYDYEDNACTGDCTGGCGHYTQIVWRTTTEVGCGMADCPDGGEIWVCNYAPPGNDGSRPY
ncbi:MAG: CAP domain-containing protein [Myxococcota bacterium]